MGVVMGPTGGSVWRSRLAEANMGPGPCVVYLARIDEATVNGTLRRLMERYACKPQRIMVLRQIPPKGEWFRRPSRPKADA
jgi:hypothetical protein